MNTSKSHLNILWVQVWVLAAVQGAITLTWLIYNIYLPQLLTQFGFPASLAVGLLLVENALGAVLEPLMGGLSDQARRWVGSRFPFISVGMILSATLFIAIPCVVSLIPPTTVMRRHRPPQASLLPITLVAWALALILGTGFGVAWGIRFLLDVLGKVLKAQLNTNNIDVQMVWIGLAIAIASIPAGMFAVKIGNRQAMLCGICAIIPSLLIIISVGAQIPLIVLIVAGFSLVVNGAIPFALGLVSQRWAGLGIGMYFGGFALAMSLFGVLFSQQQGMTPFIGAVGGALAFLLAGVCIWVSGISQTQRNAEV